MLKKVVQVGNWGNQLPRKVGKLGGRGGQARRAEITKARGELEGYEVVIRI